jgi:HEAT repeat protein
MVRNLDSKVLAVREKAEKDLVLRGSAALPFLQKALPSATLETKMRADRCISKIAVTTQSETVAAAARVLAEREAGKASEALLNFLPSTSYDSFLEEEILTIVGRLTIKAGKVDPLLLEARTDSHIHRRATAAYLLGRRGGVEHRAALRELLADADPQVQRRVAEGLLGKRSAQLLQEGAAGDEALLAGQKIEPTEAGLLEFFRKRTLSETEQQRFRTLVKSLDGAYVIREAATRTLIKEGPSVLTFLKEAESDASMERGRRVQYCLDEIRAANNTAVPIAAAHLLARPAAAKDASPADAIRALLAYIPFADDEAVEDEILTCLALLSVRESKIEPDLIKALGDASPRRRAAAAYVLGHVGDADQVATVKPLLQDADAVVRLRAAQGLLAARDKASLPALASLLETVPAAHLPRIEEALYRIAEDKGPTTLIAASTDARQQAAKTWGKWITDHQASIDLANVQERDAYLGLITVCEYDTFNNVANGQTWETSRGGTKRWNVNGLLGAMDAHALPNGRILVAENNANRVSERDTKGHILWEYRVPANPICCQRLPNGNTFIASYNMVLEVTPAKTEVYRHIPGPQFYIFSAHKARNGNIVAITAQGRIIEMDTTGKQLHSLTTNTLGNWCSVELMSNGNYLVASMSTNSVRELDRNTGQEVWSKQFMGAFRATKLPNGNVLVASMTTREVAEFDRAGTKRWSTTCTGRPWSVHYR